MDDLEERVFGTAAGRDVGVPRATATTHARQGAPVDLGVAGPRLVVARPFPEPATPTTVGRYSQPMAEPAGIERRLTSIESRLDKVESRLENVATDAAAARYLAAAHDRDLADLGVKADANRRAINALGEQTAARFDQLENEMRTGFGDVRAKLDQSAAGHEQIVGLLDHVIDRMDQE
jgi:hypothetical protein